MTGSLFQDVDQAQAWLAERFVDEDDEREPEDVPLLELIQKVYEWGDQAWYHAGKELERADAANSRLYKVSERARTAESVAREALALAREVYSWAVHEPNTRRLRERAEALETQLAKDKGMTEERTATQPGDRNERQPSLFQARAETPRYPSWVLVERYVARYPYDWRLVFRRGDEVLEVSVPEEAWRAFDA